MNYSCESVILDTGLYIVIMIYMSVMAFGLGLITGVVWGLVL